uniref:Uncharacterized protein n=1 Tax=Oryza glumipatula TaxID=40148 RepID=A0A0E0A7G4_9ORYZ
MVVADLDCSVGINTLLFVSMVISTVADAQHHNELGCHSMEFQLNDLPRNDFNRLFYSLQQLEHDFHMAIGEAEDNYANNSRLQRKALLKTKPVLDKAVRQVFKSVKQFTKSIAASHPKGVALPPFYISGLPGSYYTRLFPCQSVHLFHSSYCLHWRSQMIKDMDEKMSDINGGNIYIAKSTPPSVVKMFQDQFQKDMSLFLKL